MDTMRLNFTDVHTHFQERLGALLSTFPGTGLVGEAGSGEAGATSAEKHHPDILLMDIDMTMIGSFRNPRSIQG